MVSYLSCHPTHMKYFFPWSTSDDGTSTPLSLGNVGPTSSSDWDATVVLGHNTDVLVLCLTRLEMWRLRNTRCLQQNHSKALLRLIASVVSVVVTNWGGVGDGAICFDYRSSLQHEIQPLWTTAMSYTSLRSMSVIKRILSNLQCLCVRPHPLANVRSWMFSRLLLRMK